MQAGDNYGRRDADPYGQPDARGGGPPAERKPSRWGQMPAESSPYEQPEAQREAWKEPREAAGSV